MKSFCAQALILATLAGLAVGCGHKADAKAELEKTAAMLAQGEAAQPPPSPAAQAPAPAEAAAPAEPVSTPAATPAQEMKQAIVSYKTGELEDAVTRLQRLRATVSLTPQQRMAVQDSVAAVMTEIYSMAARGDPRAIAAVKQYEEMQTNRH